MEKRVCASCLHTAEELDARRLCRRSELLSLAVLYKDDMVSSRMHSLGCGSDLQRECISHVLTHALVSGDCDLDRVRLGFSFKNHHKTAVIDRHVLRRKGHI